MIFIIFVYSTLGDTVDDFNSPPLKCNTTKDRVKLNYTTAGNGFGCVITPETY